MHNQIPDNADERKKLVDLSLRRLRASRDYFMPWHEDYVRYYKIWRGYKDGEHDSDEPNASVPYAFGVVEMVVAKVCEVFLKMTPPCKVAPRRPGDGSKARRFSDAARAYYSGAWHQEEFIRSVRDQVIVGPAWELDTWAQEYSKGKRWAKVPKIDQETGEPYEGIAEVEHEYPERAGFFTTYPSIFEVYPEPKRKRVEEMSWIDREHKQVSLEWLRSQKYEDPSTGELVPIYDLSELLADHQGAKPGDIKPIRGFDEDDLEREIELTKTFMSRSDDNDYNDGVDRIWMFDDYQKGQLVTIAQGRYVIRRVVDHLHRPRLPWRLRNYTWDPHFLYGPGAVGPIEDLIYELEDIHNLSMANWLRIINRMVAYREGAVPFAEDDFKYRAGGKVRVRSDVDPREALMVIDHHDVTPSMLNMESNNRGLIEFASSVSDFSPGFGQTKQSHKTATGIIEIQNNLANRFALLLRGNLANAQKQMSSMEAFMSQHFWDKQTLRSYQENGSSVLVDFSRDDIDTDGVGFDYLITIDPAAGDDAIMRSQILASFDLALKYNEWASAKGGMEAEVVNVAPIMRRALQVLGWADTSEVFSKTGGAIDPGMEIELMAAGKRVEPKPTENVLGHLMEHFRQRQSPELRAAIEAGKVAPNVLMLLDEHIAQTMALARGIMADPVAAARMDKLIKSGGIVNEDVRQTQQA